MVELLFVILLGSILLSMTVRGTSTYLDRQGAQNARNAFLFLASRARSSAIERGTPVRLILDVDEDRVMVVTGSTGAGDTLETLDYSGEYLADAVYSGGDIVICYTSRGFAREDCSSNTNNVRVEFVRGNDMASARVWSLGQVEVR